jgi:Protein of unknown function, DUF481
MCLSPAPLRGSRLVPLVALSLLCLSPSGAVGVAGLVSVAVTSACLGQGRTAEKAVPKPAPDVIIFTNGDRLTGKLEKGEGDTITFNSDMAGEVTIPLAKIKELRTNGSFAVLRKGSKDPMTNVQVGKVEYEDGDVMLTGKNGMETVPAKELAFVIDEATFDKQVRPPTGPLWGLLAGWTGGVTGGATLVRSTQNSTTYTAAASLTRAIPELTYLPPRSRSLFALSETYGKLTQPTVPQTTPPTPASVAMTNIFHAGFEQDKYFTRTVFALGNVTFDHNYAQGLNLQQVYGGGVGWTAVKDARQEFDLKGQLQYERQTFQIAANNQNLIGATIGENYQRSLPRKIVFTENANVLPTFNNAKAYSANATAGLAMPMWKQFNLSFTATDNFLNNPPIGYKKNSFQFVLGVTYNLP